MCGYQHPNTVSERILKIAAILVAMASVALAVYVAMTTK